MGKYFTNNHHMPESIIMNHPTYNAFRLDNPSLPEVPLTPKDDSFKSVTGVPIEIVDSKRFGYHFSGPFTSDILLP